MASDDMTASFILSAKKVLSARKNDFSYSWPVRHMCASSNPEGKKLSFLMSI